MTPRAARGQTNPKAAGGSQPVGPGRPPALHEAQSVKAGSNQNHAQSAGEITQEYEQPDGVFDFGAPAHARFRPSPNRRC